MNGVCHCLRWKGYHPDLEPEGFEQAFLQNHVPYSCLRTGQPWGSDGDIAAPEACTPERDCYEHHGAPLARLRRARERSA